MKLKASALQNRVSRELEDQSQTKWKYFQKTLIKDCYPKYLRDSLLLNMLSRLVITFLPRSKHLLISWLQSPSAVILEPPKIKPDTVSTVSPSISHEVMRPDVLILVFWILRFKPTFSLYTFTFIKRLFSSSSLIRMVKMRNTDNTKHYKECRATAWICYWWEYNMVQPLWQAGFFFSFFFLQK